MSDIPIVPIVVASIPFIASGIYLFFAFTENQSNTRTRTHKPKQMKTLKSTKKI